MTLLHLAPLWWLLGLAVLAGVLFLLQRLRVRHREVAVPTTLFWKEAIHEARARLLVKRFRHPLAYALMFLIGALLLTAIAGPRTGEDEDARHVVLVDGSQHMAFDIDELTSYVADLPAANRSVVLCGSRLLPVLAPGEDALLLPRRLEGAVPAEAPSSVAQALRQLGRDEASGGVLHVHIADQSTRLGRIPPGLRIHRFGAETKDDTPRIVTLGIAEPASGAWGVVDLMARAAPFPPLFGGEGTLSVRTDPVLESAPVGHDSEHGEPWHFRDVPARGQEITLSLWMTGLDGESRMVDGATERVLLPDRRPIRVQLDEALAEPFGAALAADPAVELVTDTPQLVVRAQGSAIGGDVPALEVAPAGTQREALLLHHGAGLDPDKFLKAAYGELRLSLLDAQRLADAGNRPVEVRTEERTGRGITLSADLLGEPYDFVPSRDFPLFVARAVRWLAGVPPLRQRVAAGEPLEQADGSWTQGDRAAATSALGAPFTPPVAGRYQNDAGDAFVASLLASTREDLGSFGSDEPTAADFSAGSNLATLFLLLAFALLGVEWWAYRTSRVP